MLTAHRNLLRQGALPEYQAMLLVDRPFAVRAESGAIIEGRAFGYKNTMPIIEIGDRKYGGMTWLEVAAAVECGAVAEIARLRRR